MVMATWILGLLGVQVVGVLESGFSVGWTALLQCAWAFRYFNLASCGFKEDGGASMERALSRVMDSTMVAMMVIVVNVPQ